MDSNMKIGELVQLIRINCGITQRTLSEWSDIDQGSLSLYEQGKRRAGLAKRKKLIDIANEKANMNLKYTDVHD